MSRRRSDFPGAGELVRRTSLIGGVLIGTVLIGTVLAGAAMQGCSTIGSSADAESPSTDVVAAARATTAAADRSAPGPGRTAIAAAAVGRLAARRVPLLGGDTVEVWLCAIRPDLQAAPLAGEESWYVGDWRLTATAAELTAYLAPIGDAFDQASGGRYRPDFVPGGRVEVGSDATPQRCADEALAASSVEADVVLVVATAEHAGDRPGGWGRPAADACPEGCPARRSRRAAVVGAADFHPDWGSQPPLDLVTHELGHTLGWPHSSLADPGADPGVDRGAGPTGLRPAAEPMLPPPPAPDYANPFDLMSDAAAMRRVDPARRDAPAPLAVHRYLAGWIPDDEVVIVDCGHLSDSTTGSAGSGAVEVPSRGMVVIAGSAGAGLVTVEVVRTGTAPVLDDGVVLHRVDPAASPITVEFVAGTLGDGDRWMSGALKVVVSRLAGAAGPPRFSVSVDVPARVEVPGSVAVACL